MSHALILLLSAFALQAQPSDLTYGSLREGQTAGGFRATAVYLDDGDRALGGRFRHERSGFTVDLLQIQSVPQAFIWVNTYPDSNMGEPHTQEHLLLGKGNQGRKLGSRQRMSLVESSAFTQQWRTCYHFYTAAGAEVFFASFQQTMDALLHPDYSEEEVHREVRNFGVSANPQDGSLHLEEKGSVYNEMVTSMDRPIYRLFRAIGLTIYGPEHPLSFSSGGLPAALRVIQPADIKRFHDRHYFLANMGAIVSLPKDVAAGTALARLDAMLNRLEPGGKPAIPVMTDDQLPAPQPAPSGRIEILEYPFRNDQQPGTVAVLWPAERKLPFRENLMLSLFFNNVAGGPDTNLYKRLVDSKTRELDFGVKGIEGGVDDDLGNPVYVLLEDVPVAHMIERDLDVLRAKVSDEIARIAAYPDGSAELRSFNQRLQGRIVEQRRTLAKLVNSPPGFGFRSSGTASSWLQTLYLLNREPGFRKSLTAKSELAAIETAVAGDRNIWRESLAKWKITGITPYVEAVKPSVKLVEQEQAAREQRAAAEVARLKKKYGVKDDQEAIRKYRAEYDARTAAIEEAGKNAGTAKFVEHPPLTLDDPLDFKSARLAGGVPLVTSTFDSMTSATAGIALRLDGVPEDRLVYIALLPQLLTRVGVIENGQPVSYEQMTHRLRNEILSLNASFSTGLLTDRYELALVGAGNSQAESKRALEWMKLALLHPDWRPANLPRIRDLVDQTLATLRTTTQGSEERWVRDPAAAYWKQENPLQMATSSFMTREHMAQRLRWMLKAGASEGLDRLLGELSSVTGPREERIKVLASIKKNEFAGLAGLSEQERQVAVEAARDLEATLPEIPDSSLPGDWQYLCREMGRDLRQGPERTIEALDQVRRSLLVGSGARMFLVGSKAAQAELAKGLGELAGSLQPGQLTKAAYRSGGRILQRLQGREPQASAPLFVGLLNANSQGGVFLNSAPLTGLRDLSRDHLLDYLAANLYSGGGGHSIFMKTWAAGLAYSNGIRVDPSLGRIDYYAERTPELPQTLRFVIAELKRGAPDASLVEYSIAGAFQRSRAASSYEARGEAMAADLADGLTPDVMRKFRQAILDLRKLPNLEAELFRRKDAVHAKALPGMGIKAGDVKGGLYYVIGPEKQLAAYEEYLKSVEGPETRLWRLYPRDYWLVSE